MKSQCEPGQPSSVVIARTKLDEAIVCVTVPKRAMCPEENSDNCLHFAYSVNGGSVQACLRGSTEPLQLRGKRVTASIEVWKERCENGKCELRLGFCIVDDVATHRLCVTDRNEIPPRYKGGGVRFHRVPDPRAGLVILSRI